jgi:Rod binding domain-containing protein
MSISATTALTAQPADAAATRQDRMAAVALAKGGNTKALANLSQEQQIKSVAGQFESILLRQFLQDSVSKIMGGESGGSGGTGGSMYGFMLTDVLASKLSEGGGMGLSSVIQKQLSPRTAAHTGAQKPTP